MQKLHKPENAADYVERNRSALESHEAWMSSLYYQAMVNAIKEEPESAKRESISSRLREETYKTVDMMAVERALRARNRQMLAEGMRPPAS